MGEILQLSERTWQQSKVNGLRPVKSGRWRNSISDSLRQREEVRRDPCLVAAQGKVGRDKGNHKGQWYLGYEWPLEDGSDQASHVSQRNYGRWTSQRPSQRPMRRWNKEVRRITGINIWQLLFNTASDGRTLLNLPCITIYRGHIVRRLNVQHILNLRYLSAKIPHTYYSKTILQPRVILDDPR